MDDRLTYEDLDDFVRHAREAHLSRNPRPHLLADRVEILVAEVRRLRDGVADAAADAHLSGARYIGRQLEALLDQEDSDG